MGFVPRGQRKKLIGAARYWAGERDTLEHVDESLIESLQAFGAPADVIRQARAMQPLDVFEVWPENWPTVELFCALGTQWRTACLQSGFASLVVRTGIDYACVEPVMRMLGQSTDAVRERFAGVRLMEREALDVLNEDLRDA
ncbi:DUF1799 domain-containing protein [Pandoraea commovens]|uniref:DUF1799 domain-containing protein n=1 Tax=Pandoraea commovens TaxID=2508289 RepID=A0ABY5QKW6_9BURK|nr:DUF1799 domain-containing protein [Pandoraea commovens]UVA80468.1 DUF1799 domain-containing protein [Pandoraea commovens]